MPAHGIISRFFITPCAFLAAFLLGVSAQPALAFKIPQRPCANSDLSGRAFREYGRGFHSMAQTENSALFIGFNRSNGWDETDFDKKIPAPQLEEQVRSWLQTQAQSKPYTLNHGVLVLRATAHNNATPLQCVVALKGVGEPYNPGEILFFQEGTPLLSNLEQTDLLPL